MDKTRLMREMRFFCILLRAGRCVLMGSLLVQAAWAQNSGAPSTSPSASPSAPAPVTGPDWAITTAPARFIIAPDEPDKPVPISWTTLCLPDPSWGTTPIRVFTDDGKAVGSDLLWTAPGEPVTLVFDSSSGAKNYRVYLGSNWPAQHLTEAKAGVVLESRAGDGKTIDKLEDMLAAWNQSATVYGRGYVPGLFEGGHRFGPQGNILEHFQGWFNAAAPEHLELATISNDASFILIDGKKVVEWPGQHDFHPGLGGQFQGAIDLSAGPHLLEYYNAYIAGNEGHPLLCCLAIKGGDFAQWTMLTPDRTFFRPVGHAHLAEYELQTSAPSGAGTTTPPFAIDWTISGQSVIASEVPDIGLIAVQLNCHPKTGTANWTFDDGTTAQGQSVQHIFPRPGMRTVKLTVTGGDHAFNPVEQTISVHPNWTQLTTFRPQLVPEHQADIMKRDPATMTASDLAGCFAVFQVFKSDDGMRKLLPAICDKMKDVADADLVYVKNGAAHLAREDLPHAADITRLLKALIDRCGQGKPSPALVTLGSEARLALAQLTIKTSDQTDEVRSLIAAINVPSLTGEQPRALAILQADLALATGDVAGARKQYVVLGGDPSGPDARSSIRRTARIGQARAFMDRQDTEAAEDALAEVIWQAPIEKLSSDWALTRLRLDQQENLTVKAYLWAKRLLPVLQDNSRSELLFRLTDLSFAQGDQNLAQKSLAELLKKYPYSSEAAQAKEKWPGK